jgi:hypothetical protein
MKKFAIPFILFFTLHVSAQEIAENKVDEFTHRTVKRTSWDQLVYKFDGSMFAKSRISMVDSSFFLNLRYVCHGGCVMGEGDKFMLKLENDSVVTLLNLKLTAGCRGCGATGLAGASELGLDLSFPISIDQLRDLSNNKVAKIRLYLSDGYIEASVGSGNAKNLKKQAEIILK